MTSDPETLLTYTIHDLSPYTNYTLFIQCSLLTCVSGWGPLSGPIFVLTDEEGNNNFISFLYYIAMIQSSVMLHHHDSPWLFLTKEKKNKATKETTATTEPITKVLKQLLLSMVVGVRICRRIGPQFTIMRSHYHRCIDWSHHLAHFRIFGILEEGKISKEILEMNDGMIPVRTV